MDDWRRERQQLYAALRETGVHAFTYDLGDGGTRLLCGPVGAAPPDRSMLEPLAARLRAGETAPSAVVRGAGPSRWDRICLADCGPDCAVGILQDVSASVAAEHDSLTELKNRAAAQRDIRRILESGGNAHYGFLFIDVDGFKTVNDRLGHIEGDQLLRRVSDGLKKVRRPDDVLARMGGDEFLLFTQVDSRTQLAEIAGGLCRHVRQIEMQSAQGACMSISISIAVSPRDGDTFETLYRCADRALYSAKRQGKDRFAFYGGE